MASTAMGSQAAHSPDAGSNAPQWVTRLSTEDSDGTHVTVSPDGSTAFAIGYSVAKNASHGQLVAYDPTTGAQLWTNSETDDGVYTALAVSPDSSTVYVTGYGHPAGHPGNQTMTTAYDSATGAVVWTETGASQTKSNAIAVSPDGSVVYITGEKQCDDAPVTFCYLTTAYDAATGSVVWTEEVPMSSYGGTARSIAVSPNGSTVYVTGTENPPGTANTWYRTVAYDAATGATGWSAYYAGPFYANANSVVASASEVFVTGYVGSSPGTTTSYRTIAYSATTGTRLWLEPLSATQDNGNNSLAVSPDGSTVYMAGTVGQGGQGRGSFGTVAYDAATGAQAWKAVFSTPSGGGASGLAVSPDGSTVYVTGPDGGGTSSNPTQYTTVAYGSATGAETWVRRFGDTATGPFDSHASSVAVSPDGSTVYVTGGNDNLLTTLAYSSS
jgi:sugar lactone lactonase YvrE